MLRFPSACIHVICFYLSVSIKRRNLSNLATLLLIGAIGLVASSSLRLIEKSNRRRLLSSRAALSDEEICGQMRSDSAASCESILAACRKVGRILKVDPRKLRPDDTLEDLLGLSRWLGSDGATGVDTLVGDIEASIPTEQLPRGDISLTIGEVVKYFANSKHSKE